MNPNDKTLLLQKKRQLQLYTTVINWLPYWLPIFNALKSLNTKWLFEYFDCVTIEDLKYWDKILQKVPLAGLGIKLEDIKSPNDYYIHASMQLHFPGKLVLRYLPTLEYKIDYENNAAVVLEQAADTLQIPSEEEVYLFFTRFTPVFRLPFSAIALLKLQDVMNREDVCIMHTNFNWLIFRSLEDEWVWGKNNN